MSHRQEEKNWLPSSTWVLRTWRRKLGRYCFLVCMQSMRCEHFVTSLGGWVLQGVLPRRSKCFVAMIDIDHCATEGYRPCCSSGKHLLPSSAPNLKLDILSRPDRPIFLRLNPQPSHPQHVSFISPSQPPRPTIRYPARPNRRRTDCETCFVPVMRKSALEELRTNDAADLADAGLKGESECCACCADESCRAP